MIMVIITNNNHIALINHPNETSSETVPLAESPPTTPTGPEEPLHLEGPPPPVINMSATRTHTHFPL